MDPVLLRLVAVLALVTVTVVAGRLWQRRDGTIREDASDAAALRSSHLDAVGLDLVGADAGAILLGSPTCTPCDSVRRVLGELQSERPGFRWAYADAADHLELAAEQRVLRVPTLFVVEPTGRILARSSGVPRVDDLRRVLDRGRLDESAA
jgi:thiol-disulfide isomerase/thioredoxin